MFKKKQIVKSKTSIILFFLLLLSLQALVNLRMNSISESHAAAGTIVAFEETHTPMTVINTTNPYRTSPSYYDEFAEQLVNNSYVVETIDDGETINQATLSNYDILIILASGTEYTNQEVTEIGAWVRDGGSLLICTDWDYFGDGVKSLCNHFGYDYPLQDGLVEADDAVGNPFQFYIDDANIEPHDITTGVNRIEVYAATGFNDTPTDAIKLIDTDGNSTTSWDTGGFANNVPILSALAGGSINKGKLVVITDYNLWNNVVDTDGDGLENFYDSDNAALALNIINWLSIKSTKRFPLNIFSIISLFTIVVYVIHKKRKK